MAQNDDRQSEQFVADPDKKEWSQSVNEDIVEGMERMADEGGGVVIDHSFPLGEPMLRNDLVRTNKPSVDDYDPGQFES